MQLTQLIYASQPFGFDDAALNGILSSARRNNTRDGITGALICRADLYLQLLEGPRAAVTSALARILEDDRHTEVELMWSGDTTTRLFPDWAMRDDPPRSWMWTRAEVNAGAVTAASADDVRAVFTRLSREPA